MFVLNLFKESLVHLAALTTLAGFFFRDQLLLRGIFILGTVFYIAFYFLIPERPLWSAIFWNTLLVGVNIVFLALALSARRPGTMSRNEEVLFSALRALSPGQFRRVAKHAIWRVAGENCVLTTEGESLASLYYVFSGNIEIIKGGKSRTRAGNMFVGEIAFLRKSRASATVKIQKGSSYVEWPSSTLRRIIDHDSEMKMALLSVLNNDLTQKVAQS